MYYQREPESSLTSEFNQAKSSIISLQSLQLMKPIEISDTDFLELTKAKKKKRNLVYITQTYKIIKISSLRLS